MSVCSRPRQIPFRVFQELGATDGDMVDLVTDYAEHAAAARDLFKLGRLGMVGVGASEELVQQYVDRGLDEITGAYEALAGILLGLDGISSG